MSDNVNQRVLLSAMLPMPIASLGWNLVKLHRGKPGRVYAARPHQPGAVASTTGKGNGKGRRMGFLDYVSCCKVEGETDLADVTEKGLAGEFVDLSRHELASQHIDTASENSNPSCQAPPPSPSTHRSRHQWQSMHSLLPGPMGNSESTGTTHRERTPEPSKRSGLLARIRLVKRYLGDLRSKKGRKSSSSRSKASSSYAASPREVGSDKADGVSVLTISLEAIHQPPVKVDPGHRSDSQPPVLSNPGPSCQTGETKEVWRVKRGTNEGERWKAVEASYAGRYTSKVTPLRIEEETPDTKNVRRPLCRPADPVQVKAAASFNFASSTPERYVSNLQTSSVPSGEGARRSHQLPTGVAPGSPAAWAITDWTTRKSRQPSSSSHASGQAKAQSSESNDEPFAMYHQNERRATSTSTASSSSVCHDPGTVIGAGRPAADVDSNFELRQATGFKKTHRIIHVKPFSPKPTGSS